MKCNLAQMIPFPYCLNSRMALNEGRSVSHLALSYCVLSMLFANTKPEPLEGRGLNLFKVGKQNKQCRTQESFVLRILTLSGTSRLQNFVDDTSHRSELTHHRN